MQSSVFYPMPNKEIDTRLAHAEGILQNQPINSVDFSIEIKELKDDLRETLNLVRLLASLVQMPAPGAEDETAATEFEARLGAMLEKHPAVHHSSKQRDGMEGNILV
jgi:hypothetical protein